LIELRPLILALFIGSAYSLTAQQTDRKSYLLIETDELTNAHLFTPNRFITVWINDSTSYSGFFTIVELSSIQIDDTLIQTNSITQLEGRNKRRRIGAPLAVIGPTLVGLGFEVHFLINDNSLFNYWGIPTLTGVAGSILGLGMATSFMGKRTYELKPGDLQIVY
jgi:hypothetical protein